jgi:ATP-dependent RNA helicase RhlE
MTVGISTLKKLLQNNKGEVAKKSIHEKKAKNKKVNVRYDHKKAMHEKYGKPKKKRQK